MPFFFVHFGLFMGVHAVFLNLLTGFSVDRIRVADYLIPLAALLASHGLSFLRHFVHGDERQHLSPQDKQTQAKLFYENKKENYRLPLLKPLSKLMMQPYRRIIVVHLLIFIAFIPGLLFRSALPAFLILVGMKIYSDLLYHQDEHGLLSSGHVAT